jgi:hypothetical protein
VGGGGHHPVQRLGDGSAGWRPAGHRQGLVFGQSGCGSCANERWNGLLDDIRIYNRPLNTAEIQADMNNGI